MKSYLKKEDFIEIKGNKDGDVYTYFLTFKNAKIKCYFYEEKLTVSIFLANNMKKNLFMEMSKEDEEIIKDKIKRQQLKRLLEKY